VQLRAAAAREAARGATVEIGFEPSWVLGPDGTRHRLAEAYSRIVNAFLELHRRAPEAVLTIDDLVAVGWPGERPIAPSGANRVHVALAHLRRMGLRGVIERSSGGYRFVPGAAVER
jgi:hypothetical protein